MDPINRSTSDSNLDSTSASIQNLSSILNNPSSSYSYYSSFWPSSEAPPPPPPSLPDVSRSSFSPYLSSISETYSKFEHIIKHSVKDSEERSIVPARQGQALVECLREVPSLFFKEDFDLADGPTFESASSFSVSDGDESEGSDRLTQYLDCVEMHLVREIELRSESFYEAQGKLVGLNGEIVKACDGIRRLKEGIRALEGDLVGCAKVVQELNGARSNLVALQQKLTVILYVSQAVSALKLLVAGADCAGALDVIDDLQHLLDTDELAGLHCFRHLRDQLSTSLDSINSILSAEFVRASMHDARAVDSAIVSKIKTSAPFLMNGLEEESLNDDESSFLRDRLLPLIVGLLRTAKLPTVLRIYRETLITEMKAAIKSTVAELLPILLARPLESDSMIAENTMDSEGSNLSLASKLRSLSSESFVQLLFAIFKIVQAHLMRAAEVKRVIEWIMGNIDGGYPTDTVGQGSGGAGGAEESDNQNMSPATYSFPRNTQKISLFQGRINESSSPITSKNFLADVLRENTEAVFAACDTAHGRWTKLLGVRALLHPKLRLQEFLSIYNITQDFITITEKIGGRLGYSIRGTLQSQSKAFVDFQHESRMAKIKAVLDQETWVSVDVPDEFQAIVSSFASYELPLNERTASHSEDNSSTPPNDRNTNGQTRTTSQTLVFRGVGYHMVNCGLILLKMLAEYVDISKSLPTLSSEVVHRVSEILKLFNNRTCQLILGAGAMQVSGLKSITSKHLALASQVISFVYAIIPEIRSVLFLKIPEARKAILVSEIERVAQDYKIHRDEIHTKLVQIMRERLLANIRKLPQIVETWNGPEDDDPKPSLFAKHVTKQATYLHQILAQILLEADVLEIFRQVVHIFHSHISEAFSKLDLNTPQAKKRLKRDIEHILGCLRMLPSDDSSGDSPPNYGLLDEFMAEKFGPEESQS